MDFIFDQFVELPTEKKKFYVVMSDIAIVEPVEVDTCDVYLRGGGAITGVKMPALVLVEKIVQRRKMMQYELFANTYRITTKK